MLINKIVGFAMELDAEAAFDARNAIAARTFASSMAIKESGLFIVCKFPIVRVVCRPRAPVGAVGVILGRGADYTDVPAVHLAGGLQVCC